MSIAQHLKQIGRGRDGARALDAADARDLMDQLLDGRAGDQELGAFCLAMRMKGETLDEVVGFLDSAQSRVLAVPSEKPAVVLPSYNGARRLPNLSPLLAMRLAQEGINVLVHGPRHDPARVGSAEIFRSLGLPPAESAAAAMQAWSRGEPAFMPTDVLCPPLQRLLDARHVIGLRNSGHTVAKMLDPCRGVRSLRVMPYTHPEFGALMAAYAELERANAMVLRGTEGEPGADPRRCPKMDTWLDGRWHIELSCQAQEGTLSSLPILPRAIDAATTALYIQAVASGEKPAPAPLERQVELIARAVATFAAPHRERRA